MEACGYDEAYAQGAGSEGEERGVRGQEVGEDGCGNHEVTGQGCYAKGLGSPRPLNPSQQALSGAAAAEAETFSFGEVTRDGSGLSRSSSPARCTH